ncbi:hypothetical protein [Pedobacter flavus]|uniref:Uncharacterized protein n=1 Tax=Pedobacter flavus TaxID=3113906 RepID=A0ABU7H279_9SPHI|nr:hypothetical protein [Pedobacter sp. VNH31]MEE1885425.1 hypothetical protein [Pedobacter sp. VNH31]
MNNIKNHYSYSFRKSAINKNQYWDILHEGLFLQEAGKEDKIIPYNQIKLIRLSFKPILDKNNSYSCSIDSNSGTYDILSNSYKSIGKYVDKTAEYNEFIKNLIEQLKSRNPNVPVIKENNTRKSYLKPLALLAILLSLYQIIFYFPENKPLEFNLIIGLIILSISLYVLDEQGIKVNKDETTIEQNK